LQALLARIFSRLMKSWSWLLLILLTIAIKWISLYPDFVEKNYSLAAYPLISRVQRLLFGWIPFSLGDVVYGFLWLVVFYKTWILIRDLFRKKVNRAYLLSGMQQIFFFILFVYVFFNLLWGLNYNRTGIAGQLGLEVKKYAVADLDTLTGAIENKLNYYAQFVTKEQRDSFNKKSRLFYTAGLAYQDAAKKYPFLSFKGNSTKPSLYSYLGNYLGFQGYYNPFSGEAQVNTTVPRFIEPFVTSHEIAHQLGYARENEANFVGFLATHRFPNNAFLYSVYYDMYNYCIIELGSYDTTLAHASVERLHPQVKNDIKTYRDFYKRYRNPVEPIVMWGYGQFLKANNQPEGKRSYNEVVLWLVAYYKKYGREEL